MPVSFETGDLFATDGLRAFAHGCNCAGAMGKGIAVAFRERWPAMYKEYHRLCLSGQFVMGDVFTWEEGGYTVFNLGTQPHWRKKAELWAVTQSLARMVSLAVERNIPEIGLPKIAAGLGGLDWQSVRQALEQVASTSKCRLRVCETFVAGQPLRA